MWDSKRCDLVINAPSTTYSIFTCSLQMGMSGAQFGQQYSQAGVQQMGTPGVNGQQLQNKTALSNNLPQFSSELKGAGSVPNMVSVKPSLCFPVCVSYQEFVSGLCHLQPSVTTISMQREDRRPGEPWLVHQTT